MLNIPRILCATLAVLMLPNALSESRNLTSRQAYEFFKAKKLFTSDSARKITLDPEPVMTFDIKNLLEKTKTKVGNPKYFGAVQQTRISYFYAEIGKETGVDIEVISYTTDDTARKAAKYFDCVDKNPCDSVKYNFLKAKSNLVANFTFIVNKPSEKEVAKLKSLFDQM